MAKILIADDDEYVIEQVRSALHRFGHKFISARDGQTAQRRLEEDIYDLAIIDHMLPKVSGLKLVESELIKRPEDRVPIILITGDQSSSTMKKARELGVADFITKPFNSRELVSKIMAVLKQEVRIACLGGRNGSLHSSYGAQDTQQDSSGFYSEHER